MLEARGVRARYAGATADSLSGARLAVGRGERVALLGANGAGKSTLSRVLNGSVAPREGEVLLGGLVVRDRAELARRVGLVRQDPRSQLVSPSVADEVAFGPRNLGLEEREVSRRVAGALEACGLADLTGRGTAELSGGQQQRLALAGVLAMEPEHLVLDEVLAQLDPGSRRDLARSIDRAGRRGTGVVSVTHRLEELVGAERAVVLERGSVAWEGVPDALLADPALLGHAGLACDGLEGALPLLARAGARLADIGDARRLAELVRAAGLAGRVRAALPEPPAAPVGASGPMLELAGATVRYGGLEALRDVSLALAPGTVTLVAGASGSGKTTLARVAAGVLAPDGGAALLAGAPVRPAQVGLAFQRPEDQLFCDTVLDDVAFAPRARGLGERDALARARAACERLGIPEGLLARHPLQLSGGQRRLVALAGIVALDAAAYVLDEPTAGLDGVAAGRLRALVRSLAEEGRAVAVVSHEVGEWLPLAHRVALVSGGRVAWQGPAAELVRDPAPFAAAGLEAPLWVRLARELAGGAR